MLSWAVFFFIILIIAALFGFGGVATGVAEMALFLFYLFLAIFVLLLLVGLISGRRPPPRP